MVGARTAGAIGTRDGARGLERGVAAGADRPRPDASPTYPPPPAAGLSTVLARNIHSLQERRQREEAQASVQEKIADAITRFTGSMPFVYIHLAAFGFWIVANLGWVPGVPRWDESFVVLAMIASVEAIFLSTFVLISQNRMQAAADKRADLDLQISLLAEHEVTKLAALVSEIGKRLGVETEVDDELREIKRDVAPEAVLDEIDAAKP
jgi:uncharacterized membrane protein